MDTNLNRILREEVEITCGGAPLIGMGDDAGDAAISDDAKDGTQIGKRYVSEAGDLPDFVVGVDEERIVATFREKALALRDRSI